MFSYNETICNGYLNADHLSPPGILQHLLLVKWKGPVLVELHTRHFDAMGLYFKHAPAAIPDVVKKLFELLTSLPVTRVSDSLLIKAWIACARGTPVPFSCFLVAS